MNYLGASGNSLRRLLYLRGSSTSSGVFLRASTPITLARFSAASAKHEPNVTEEMSSIAHFTKSPTIHPLGGERSVIWDNPIPHAVYDLDAIKTIPKTHYEPKKLHDRVALFAVRMLRASFDIASGYRGPGGGMTKGDWLNRCLFLETVAGVPGMVGGMARHLRSLRSMRRDYGWIHTLLEEAENERMHLLIFMNMRKPGRIFRWAVLGAQGVFFNMFFLTYLVSPRTCHRFVGYLEEEAVKTYTSLLQDIEDGNIPDWKTDIAPLIARSYYKLPEDATVYDMIKCVRADEANHRDVNHTFASLDQETGVNPFIHKH